MLDHDHHEGFDQVLEENLARHGLRSLDHHLDVQLRDGCADRGSAGGCGSFVRQMRVALVELLDLAVRAPLEIAVSGAPQIDVRNFLDAPRGIEPGGYLTGQRLVLHEAVLVGGSNGFFVQTHRIGVSPFQARNLGRHQCVLVGEGRRIAFGPLAQLLLVRRQQVTPGLLLVGRSRLKVNWTPFVGPRDVGFKV